MFLRHAIVHCGLLKESQFKVVYERFLKFTFCGMLNCFFFILFHSQLPRQFYLEHLSNAYYLKEVG